MEQTPVTYFPLETQRQLVRNREAIRGKPYAHLFDETLTLPTRVLPALSAPMSPSAAVPLTREGLNSLLEPGYHEVEDGHCLMPSGQGYTTSLVDFPGCTGEMLRWWFWWHVVESERYTLWYPHNHVRCVPRVSPAEFEARRAADRLEGISLDVDEYIGPYYQEITIEIVDPADFGFDVARFDAANVAGAGCARVWLRRPRIAVASMVHLVRNTTQGFELRSRYWMGHEPELALGRARVPLRLASRLGLGPSRRYIARMAYEQLLHDQIEFTHLATFLARAFTEFGTEALTLRSPNDR